MGLEVEEKRGWAVVEKRAGQERIFWNKGENE
jgi:hypothetical protein